MATARAQARDRTTAAILAAARKEVAEKGGIGLSMRAIARKVGLASSAVYRHFPSRDALLTAMILESYAHLDDALGQVDHTTSAADWRCLAYRFRNWGRESPAEFQLIYGTPISGYGAPTETIPAAAAVARHFLNAGAHQTISGFDGHLLINQFRPVAAQIPNADPSAFAAGLAELAALVGFVSLELAGHFAGTADPADHLYLAMVDRQVDTLHLPDS